MSELLVMSKQYLNLTGSYDDELLEILIESAEEYLNGAGVKDKENKLYRLAIMMLVTNWYENREQITNGVPKHLELGLQSIILQLKAGNKREFDQLKQ